MSVRVGQRLVLLPPSFSPLDVAQRVSAAADTTQSAEVFVDGNPVTFRAVGGGELDWRVTAAFDEYKLAGEQTEVNAI